MRAQRSSVGTGNRSAFAGRPRTGSLVEFIGPPQDLYFGQRREILDTACATPFREKLGRGTPAGQVT